MTACLRRESSKCTAEKLSELVEREGIVPAAYVGRYNWVSLERLDWEGYEEESSEISTFPEETLSGDLTLAHSVG